MATVPYRPRSQDQAEGLKISTHDLDKTRKIKPVVANNTDGVLDPSRERQALPLSTSIMTKTHTFFLS
ncbi:hypothetical protein APHAL10511_003804 [Amanita phalloides]|nr:hypothetical protein APHAL10511_003804 [Amanita phalloides]